MATDSVCVTQASGGSVASRFVRRARIALVACFLAALLTACAAPAGAPLVASAAPGTGPTVTRSVHVVSRGWHASLVLRGDDVALVAWPAKADFADATYLEVGWGDREYYQAADPDVWLALKAAFWPRPGVLHVVAFDAAVERYVAGTEVIEIGVTEPGLQRLLERLRDSHELDVAGRPIALGPGLYGKSRFYASRDRFHLFKTCNVWVATALREAGVPVTPALAFTAGRLMAQLRPLGRVPETRLPATAPPRTMADVPRGP